MANDVLKMSNVSDGCMCVEPQYCDETEPIFSIDTEVYPVCEEYEYIDCPSDIVCDRDVFPPLKHPCFNSTQVEQREIFDIESIYIKLLNKPIYRVSEKIIQLVFIEGADAGYVDFTDAFFPREVMEEKLRQSGIKQEVIDLILQDKTILISENVPEEKQRKIIAHEFFHRLYRELPIDVKKDFENAWYSLPQQWKLEIVYNVWQNKYISSQYAEEFWAYLIQDVCEIIIEDKSIPKTIAQLLSVPQVWDIIDSYNLIGNQMFVVKTAKVQVLSN